MTATASPTAAILRMISRRLTRPYLISSMNLSTSRFVSMPCSPWVIWLVFGSTVQPSRGQAKPVRTAEKASSLRRSQRRRADPCRKRSPACIPPRRRACSRAWSDRMTSHPDPDLSAAAAEADDDAADELPSLPAGTNNYMTPAGFRRLDDELRQLSRIERPKVVEVVAWAAGNGDRSENGDYIYGKRRLREIDRRIRFLRKRLEIAKVVDPAQQTTRDRVFFGATVTYVAGSTREGQERERTVRIVGIDETD